MAETGAAPAPLMSWADLRANTMPMPTESIRTGDGDTDIVDLWLPRGEGPHPVVVMVHGGCWQKSIADRGLMNFAAEDLRQQGLAVWNIEYRGVDEEGGGYPGTYLDVATAADALRDHADSYNLNLDRITGIGHSAGGHLVTWLSARANLPKSSPLYADNPLPFYGVINSGGLADLEASAPVTFDGCLADIMDTLVGQPSEARPNVFSDTSPAELMPTGTKTVSLNGAEDTIAPPRLGAAYTAKASLSGMSADFVSVPATGHVELVAPGTAAFERQTDILREFFRD